MGPGRVGAAGSLGQTVSKHAEYSTSLHSETRSKKKKKPYSRSGVDSALNSFGIAGGATEEARGWETGRRQPVGAKKAVPGRKAGPDIIPVANMDTYRKKS